MVLFYFLIPSFHVFHSKLLSLHNSYGKSTMSDIKDENNNQKKENQSPTIRQQEEFVNIMVYSMQCNEPELLKFSSLPALDLGVMADLGKLFMSACNACSSYQAPIAASSPSSSSLPLSSPSSSSSLPSKCDWNIAIYVDGYPAHYVVQIKKRSDGNGVQMDRETLQKHFPQCIGNMEYFLERFYRKDAHNVLLIGGHGDLVAGRGVFFPIDTFNNCLDVNELAQLIQKKCGGGTTPMSAKDKGEEEEGERENLRDSKEEQHHSSTTTSTPNHKKKKKQKINNNSNDNSAKTLPLSSLIKKPFDYIALDTCGLSHLDTVITLEKCTDYVVAYEDDTPWNGSISTSLVQILISKLPQGKVLEALQLIADTYAKDALSQEQPSGMSILCLLEASKLHSYIVELFDKLHKNSSNSKKMNKSDKDILEEAERLLLESSSQEKTIRLKELKEMLTKVVIYHRIPNNAKLKNRCGLLCRI